MAIKDYSTYIPTGGVDWAKLTEDIVGKVNAIGTSRQAEKDALDLMMTEANALMNKEELYSSQKLQEFVLAGADSGRQLIAQWNADLKNGLLSPKDYKNRMNNIKDGWTTLANSAKTYDKANQEFMDRQLVDPKLGFSTGSGLEQYQAEIFAEVGELGDKRVFFDPETGKPYTAKITPEGIDPSTMTPTFRYAAPNNFFDNNIDVNAIITSGTKDLASYKVENGRETISDPLQNPATANAVVLLKNGILSNPRYIAQVLDRYAGDYDYYRTDAEKDNKVSSMLNTKIEARKLSGAAAYTDEEIDKIKKDLGEQLILVRADNTGVYQPVISDKQREIADKYILDQIKSRIEYEKTLDEPAYRGGGGGGGGGNKNKDEDNKTDPYLYEIYDAFTKGGVEKLNELAGGKIFTTFKGKYALIPDDPKDDPSVFFPNVWDTFKQFGYNSKAGEFREKMKTIWGEKNAGSSIPSATNQEWLNTGEWTQDQINKAVENNQINVT